MGDDLWHTWADTLGEVIYSASGGRPASDLIDDQAFIAAVAEAAATAHKQTIESLAADLIESGPALSVFVKNADTLSDPDGVMRNGSATADQRRAWAAALAGVGKLLRGNLETWLAKE